MVSVAKKKTFVVFLIYHYYIKAILIWKLAFNVIVETVSGRLETTVHVFEKSNVK